MQMDTLAILSNYRWSFPTNEKPYQLGTTSSRREGQPWALSLSAAPWMKTKKHEPCSQAGDIQMPFLAFKSDLVH